MLHWRNKDDYQGKNGVSKRKSWVNKTEDNDPSIDEKLVVQNIHDSTYSSNQRIMDIRVEDPKENDRDVKNL